MKKTVAGLCALIIASSVSAASKTWNGSVGDYNTAGNWSPSGVPVNGDSAYISGGVATLDSATNYVGIVYVGRITTALDSQFNMMNSTYTVTNLYLANAVNNHSSTLCMTNSTLNIVGGGSLSFAYLGTNQNNTANLNNSTIDLSTTSGGVNAGGVFFHSVVAATPTGATNSTVTVNLSNGSKIIGAKTVSVGNGTASYSTLNLTGGSSLAMQSGGFLYIGTSVTNAGAGSDTGVVSVAGGSSILAGTIRMGQNQLSNYGILNISGGGSVTGDVITIGNECGAEVSVDGGTLNIAGAMTIGNVAGTASSLSMSNGAVISAASLALGNATNAVRVAGGDVSFNMSGDITANKTNATFTFDVMDNGGISTLNSGGTVNVTGSRLVINLNGKSLDGSANRRLFQGASVSGTFSSVLIDGADGAAKIVYGADYIDVVPITLSSVRLIIVH